MTNLDRVIAELHADVAALDKAIAALEKLFGRHVGRVVRKRGPINGETRRKMSIVKSKVPGSRAKASIAATAGRSWSHARATNSPEGPTLSAPYRAL